MGESLYQIRECERESCRLRFPILKSDRSVVRCPICRASTRLVGSYPIDQPTAHVDENLDNIRLEPLLDNIRSAWNVGSIFRTSEGVGINHLHLCGITPTPENPKVLKTSLGTETTIHWTYYKNGTQAVKKLKSSGYQIWALENLVRAVPLQQVWNNPLTDPHVILVIGNEVCGIDPGILEQCDQIIYLSMCGEKRSYNAAVAFGIAAYALCHDRFMRPR